MASLADHWDTAYQRGQENLSWYQEEATVSLRFLDACGVTADKSVVDVGGGASVLVADLAQRGFRDVTVVDVSQEALRASRERFAGEAPPGLEWVAADVSAWQPPRTFDVWHDRAVLHFLVTEEVRDAYLRTLLAGTHAGSTVIIGVFGPDGPEACSGLPTRRYSTADVQALVGERFAVVAEDLHDHTTPAGAVQQFQWVGLQRLL